MTNRTATVSGAVLGAGSMLVTPCGAAVMIVLGSDSSLSTGYQQGRLVDRGIGGPGRRKSSDPTASVDWMVRDGDHRIVVMNADGSPGVAAAATFTLAIPQLYGYGLVAVEAGLVATALGAVLVVLGVRRPRRPRSPQSGPAQHRPALLTAP
jgi:hypothetical protein